MEPMVRWTAIAGIVLTLAGCASQQERFFKRSLNEANSDLVAKRFGPPHHSQELTSGETVWSYEYRNGSCKGYVLTFDRAKVLRDWKKHEC